MNGNVKGNAVGNIQEFLSDDQVTGGGNGEKFRKPLDDAEQDKFHLRVSHQTTIGLAMKMLE